MALINQSLQKMLENQNKIKRQLTTDIYNEFMKQHSTAIVLYAIV